MKKIKFTHILIVGGILTFAMFAPILIGNLKGPSVVTIDGKKTVYGMYIDKANTYEVRDNKLIEITPDHKEKVVMQLSNRQVKQLEKNYKKSFILDLKK